MTNQEFTDFFHQVIGGDKERFFAEHWRKRPLYVQKAVPQLTAFYDSNSFEHDFSRSDTSGAALVISLDEHGNRRMLRAENKVEISDVLGKRDSLVLQALLLSPSIKDIPKPWLWFVELHRLLCAYLLPGLPTSVEEAGAVTAVDFFYALTDVSSGGHYDTGDVFYFVLDGTKEWVLESEPERNDLARISKNGSAHLRDQPSTKDRMVLELGPGDSLYVPPHTYHRVLSRGRSLAVSLGLPAHTEISLLKVALARVEREQGLYDPLPVYPSECDLLSKHAQDQIRSKVMAEAQAALDLILNKFCAIAET